jgi:hypothetical protein
MTKTMPDRGVCPPTRPPTAGRYMKAAACRRAGPRDLGLPGPRRPERRGQHRLPDGGPVGPGVADGEVGPRLAPIASRHDLAARVAHVHVQGESALPGGPRQHSHLARGDPAIKQVVEKRDEQCGTPRLTGTSPACTRRSGAPVVPVSRRTPASAARGTGRRATPGGWPVRRWSPPRPDLRDGAGRPGGSCPRSSLAAR